MRHPAVAAVNFYTMGSLDMIRPEYRITYDVAMTFLAFVTVCLRLHVRYFYKPRKSRPNSKRKHSVAYVLGDVFMVVGMIICISFAGSDIWLEAIVIREPLSSSGKDIEGWLELRKIAAKVLTYQYFMGAIGLYCIKTSFLCYYFDAREGLSRNLRITLYVTTGLIAASFVTIMGYLIGKCQPLSNYWYVLLSFFRDCRCCSNEVQNLFCIASRDRY